MDETESRAHTTSLQNPTRGKENHSLLFLQIGKRWNSLELDMAKAAVPDSPQAASWFLQIP